MPSLTVSAKEPGSLPSHSSISHSSGVPGHSPSNGSHGAAGGAQMGSTVLAWGSAQHPMYPLPPSALRLWTSPSAVKDAPVVLLIRRTGADGAAAAHQSAPAQPCCLQQCSTISSPSGSTSSPRSALLSLHTRCATQVQECTLQPTANSPALGGQSRGCGRQQQGL